MCSHLVKRKAIHGLNLQNAFSLFPSWKVSKDYSKTSQRKLHKPHQVARMCVDGVSKLSLLCTSGLNPPKPSDFTISYRTRQVIRVMGQSLWLQ